MHCAKPWPCMEHVWRMGAETAAGSKRASMEPLDPRRHDRAAFSCGAVRLDNFLERTARKHQAGDFTRVCCDGGREDRDSLSSDRAGARVVSGERRMRGRLVLRGDSGSAELRGAIASAIGLEPVVDKGDWRVSGSSASRHRVPVA